MFAGGTLLQKVSSCLEVLDSFMKQPYPIVGSMVVADKFMGSGTDNLTACVSSIMGMSNITKSPKYANSSCLNFLRSYTVNIIHNHNTISIIIIIIIIPSPST